jgi:DNA repair exonuclease SbcCD ATPase subunit
MHGALGRLSLFAALTLFVLGCGRSAAPSPPPPPVDTSPALAAPAPVAPMTGEDLQGIVARQEEENAFLRQKLAEREETVDVLQSEVQRLQSRAQHMEATLERLNNQPAAGTSGESPATPDLTKDLVAAREAADAAHKQLAAARDELSAERHRREDVESQLARIKEETSTAPLTVGANEQLGESSALQQARQEVDDLRSRLEAERSQREQLAVQLQGLQEKQATSQQAAGADLQLRLTELQARHDEIVASAQRDLTASREREASLQGELVGAQQELVLLRERASQVAVPVATLDQARAENDTLRARVEEIERRNRDLNAKLRTAMRVADLIFKMRAGQIESVAPPRR